jgi:nitrite reductase (NO-forming)
MGRFAGTVHFYLAAGGFLVAGATLGAVLVSGRVAGSHQNLHAAHVHANVFGWVGLSVVGTLFTLWPTVLRTRMVNDVMVAAGRSLWFLAAGLTVAVSGFALGARWIALAGLAAYAAGVVIALAPFVQTWRRKAPRDAAAWSLAAGAIWLVACVGADIVFLLRARDVAAYLPGLDALVPVLVVGFALQTLIGALTYLIPVIRGGGPRMMRGTIEQLSYWWHLRVPAFNVGVGVIAVAAMAHLPAAASRVGWVLMAVSVALFLGLVVMAVLPAAERLPVVAVSIGLVVIVAPAVVAVSAHSQGHGPSRIAVHEGDVTELPISLVDMDIRPELIELPAGRHLRLVITNHGLSPHNLVFANGPATPMLARGERATIDFDPPSGRISGWCTVPGHRAAGMTLDLRVSATR